jgi:hypothetical protein
MNRKTTDLLQVVRYLTAAICGMALAGFIQLGFAWFEPGSPGPEWWTQQVVFLLLVFTTVTLGGIDQSRKKKQQQQEQMRHTPPA